MRAKTKKNESYSKLLLGEGDTSTVDEDGFVMELPAWADEKQIEIGQKFFLLNVNAMSYALMMGLMGAATSNSLLKVLMFTKQSSTPELAYRRYKANGLHSRVWLSGPIKPGTEAWRSLEVVRKMHVTVGKRYSRTGKGILSQKDMAVTLFLFMGFQVLLPEQFGIVGSREQFEAFNHLWRVIGFMLGTEDRFNCCGETVEETRGRLEAIRQDVMKPGIQFAPPEFWSYTRTAVEGMWHFDQSIHYDSMMWMLQRACGVPGYYYFDHESDGKEKRKFEGLSVYTRFRIFLNVIIFEHLSQIFIFRWIFNILKILLALFNIYPITAVLTYGKKYAFVEIMKSKN